MASIALTSDEAARRRAERIAEANAHLPTVCTRYEFINALQELGLYDRLFAAWQDSPELQFYWGSVNNLDRADANFRRLAEQLGADDAQLDSIFRKVKELR